MKIKMQKLDKKSFKTFREIIRKPETKPEISNPEIYVWLGISDIKLCNGMGQLCWLSI